MKDFLVEYWQFVRANRKFWMIPLVITLLAIGALLFFASGTAVAPFIYTLF